MQTVFPIPCIIVAGGKSSRMGSDKALLHFGGTTLTQYQLARLKGLFSSLHVSCKTCDKFDFEASYIKDTQEFTAFSPLVALYSILIKFDTPVFILSVDTPFVDEHIFAKLYAALDEKTDVLIARSPFGSHQLCGIYKPRIAEQIKLQIEKNEHKIRALYEYLCVNFVDFTDDSPFFNMNFISDYEHAKRLV
ncbi:MAG: molybdenum cofactor guanylyltransferase [Sulfurospirillum sp.]|nr:molybdenum cofactor guanylyltransferase [Sulfurospirillum sp.]